MSLKFPDCDVLCFSKLPQEPQRSQLIEWLEAEEARKVVVFNASESLSHSRFLVCDQDRKGIEVLAKEHVFLRFDYVEQEEGDAALFSSVEEIVEGVALCASDFRERGVDRLRNLLTNSQYFERAFKAAQLFGAFPRVPAIICGAGPSLDLDLPYLRLLQDQALFFSGGATLMRLSQLGLRPHFTGMIDPHPPRQVDRMHAAFEAPCFFQSRTHPEKLGAMQGPLLWTPGCEQDFLEDEFFEGGWNVATFLTAIACHLGCSPIILVGVDLCGDEGQIYSGEITQSEGLFELPSGRQTKQDWLIAARFLSDFAKRHPEVEWINASGGIELGGFESRRLEEVVFASQYDLNGMIHSLISNLKSGVMPAFKTGEVHESLQRVSAISEQLLHRIEKMFPLSPDGDGEYTILEIELEREEAYSRFAKPVWDIWSPVIARSIPPELSAQGLGLKLNQWLFIKGICDDARQV